MFLKFRIIFEKKFYLKNLKFCVPSCTLIVADNVISSQTIEF